MAITRRTDKKGKTCSYKIDVFVGYDDDGKRRRHVEIFHGNKEAALVREGEIKKAKYNGSMLEPHRFTLNQYLAEWLHKSARLRLKTRTLQDYTGSVERYVKETIGHIPLARVSPLTIQGLYNDLSAKGLSPQTVRNLHTVLLGALKQAKRWRYIAENPAADVDLPKPTKKQPVRAFNEEQLGIFIEGCQKPDVRHGVLFQFALAAGARPEEYLALQWPDLDWKNCQAKINKTLFRPKKGPNSKPGAWTFETTKTKGSDRTIDLPAETMELLRRHRKAQLEQRLYMGPEWRGGHDFVFPGQFGQPLWEAEVWKIFKELCKDLGLPPEFRLYDLRHTCATLMLLNGEAAKIVSEHLGHSGVAITLDTYSHVLPSMKKGASERLGALLFQNRKP